MKYTVLTNDKIHGLNICGPLTEPTTMTFGDVLSMVRKGYEVYAHNPYNLADKQRVTVKNIGQISFPIPTKEMLEQTMKVNVVEEKPQEKNEEPSNSTEEVEKSEETEEDESKNDSHNNNNWKQNKKNRYDNNQQKLTKSDFKK